jgi:uncharacterized phiE125 gp8 family phage protein
LGNEPVTLADAKEYLKVESAETADDNLITDIIKVARNWCEAFTARALITQTWKLSLDAFPGVDLNHNPRAQITLPKGNTLSVTAFTYVDGDGVAQDMVGVSPLPYALSTEADSGGILEPAYGEAWPGIQDVMDAIQITYTAGYGPNASDMPEQLRMAVKWKMADLYDNRGDADISGAKANVAESLARPYRLERIF